MPFINYFILEDIEKIKDGWNNADDEFKKQLGAKLSPQFSFLLKQLGLSYDQYIDECYDFIIFLSIINHFSCLIHNENFKYRLDGN